MPTSERAHSVSAAGSCASAIRRVWLNGPSVLRTGSTTGIDSRASESQDQCSAAGHDVFPGTRPPSRPSLRCQQRKKMASAGRTTTTPMSPRVYIGPSRKCSTWIRSCRAGHGAATCGTVNAASLGEPQDQRRTTQPVTSTVSHGLPLIGWPPDTGSTAIPNFKRTAFIIVDRLL